MRWTTPLAVAVLILGSTLTVPAAAQSRSAERTGAYADGRSQARSLVRTVDRAASRRVIDAPALVGRRVSQPRLERVMPTERAARATYDSESRRSRFEPPADRHPAAGSRQDTPTIAELRSRIAELEQRLDETQRAERGDRHDDSAPHAGYDPGPDHRLDHRPVVIPRRSGTAYVVRGDGRSYHPVSTYHGNSPRFTHTTPVVIHRATPRPHHAAYVYRAPVRYHATFHHSGYSHYPRYGHHGVSHHRYGGHGLRTHYGYRYGGYGSHHRFHHGHHGSHFGVGLSFRF